MMGLRKFFARHAPEYLQKAQSLRLLPNPYVNGRRITDPVGAYGCTVVGTYRPASVLSASSLRPSHTYGYENIFNNIGKHYDVPVAFGFYEVEDVKVWPRFGVHYSRFGNFLDVYCGLALSNPKYEIPRLSLPFIPATSMAQGVFLGPSWYHNFYHWMVDIVPRLQIVASELKKGMPLILPEILSETQNDVLRFALRKLDLDHIEVVRPSRAPLRFDRLVMPTAISAPLDVSPAQRSFLRSIIPEEPSKAGKRLYISRRDAAVRRIANEGDVEAVLAQYGFETVTLSGRSITEQANLFRHAEAIVGHHGAGLTNLAFCEPSTVAIEVFQCGHFTPSFARMAQIGELTYGFAVGEPVGDDTWLDPSQLKELIVKSGLDLK